METKKINLYDKLSQAYYFFQFNSETKTFSLFINNSIMEQLEDLSLNNRLTKVYEEKYFPMHTSYIGSFKNVHGFNDCGKIEGIFGNFLKISFKLSPTNTRTGKKCSHCKGTGKSPISDLRCFYCRGIKKEIKDTSLALHAIVNTISLLLKLLSTYTYLYMYDDKSQHDIFETKYSEQLYMIETYTGGGSNGHAVGGSGSGFFIKKLLQFFEKKAVRDETFKSFSRAYAGAEESFKKMMDVYAFLNDVILTHKKETMYVGCDGVEAKIRQDGLFHLQTEGINSCSLFGTNDGPHSHWYKEKNINGEGFNITCHNLDSAFQQMVLLVGLAGLTEEILS